MERQTEKERQADRQGRVRNIAGRDQMVSPFSDSFCATDGAIAHRIRLCTNRLGGMTWAAAVDICRASVKTCATRLQDINVESERRFVGPPLL
jgi:hypothetical protein